MDMIKGELRVDREDLCRCSSVHQSWVRQVTSELDDLQYTFHFPDLATIVKEDGRLNALDNRKFSGRVGYDWQENLLQLKKLALKIFRCTLFYSETAKFVISFDFS